MNSKRMIMGLAAILLGIGVCIAIEQAPVEQDVANAYPGLASGALGSAKLAVLPVGVLMRSGDLKITQKDLNDEISKSPESVRTQLRNNAFFVLENLAVRRLVAAEARAWSKQTGRMADEDEAALMRAYFESITAGIAVTDEDVKAFYDGNKDMMGGATFDQVKEQLKDYLLDEKRQEAVNSHIASIGTRTAIEVSKSWAARQYPLAMNNPVDKARKSGKPTMVDFGADKCRPCDMMVPILDSLKKEYAGKLNVVFVHVRKEQILAARYGIQSIPVQVFYDKAGKEAYRHVGFFPKEQIVAKLVEVGVK